MKSINGIHLAKLVKAIVQRPRSTDQLIEITGLHRQTVRHCIKCFKKEGLVYIYRWDKSKRNAWEIPMYSFGEGVDALKPKPRSRITANIRYHEERDGPTRPAIETLLIF